MFCKPARDEDAIAVLNASIFTILTLGNATDLSTEKCGEFFPYKYTFEEYAHTGHKEENSSRLISIQTTTSRSQFF